ncbi:hypothetical protein JG688_00013245 [Phytophthora aleatoria]|uniref:Uncharacterized protein n=1 Tax=Phytophthora aleatoria TaxID=2496075 RepID=A0A8J5J1W5_9STRA|nr:hypothetical protein JG688_00013245 [Phytophthora aleatoria]
MQKWQPPDRKLVTDGCVATYRCAATQSIAKSHDGPERTTSRSRRAAQQRISAATSGRTCGLDARGCRTEITYQGIAERRTRSPNADRRGCTEDLKIQSGT